MKLDLTEGEFTGQGQHTRLQRAHAESAACLERCEGRGVSTCGAMACWSEGVSDDGSSKSDEAYMSDRIPRHGL